MQERFREAIQEHDEYEFAHAAFRHSFRNEFTRRFLELDKEMDIVKGRITTVERFAWTLAGGLIVIGTLTTALGAVVLVHFWH